MIREMYPLNCLIGLNYCKSFITDGGIGDSSRRPLPPHRALFSASVPRKTSLSAPTLTVRHFPTYLNIPAKAADLYEYFLEKECQRICRGNHIPGTHEKFFQKKSIICIPSWQMRIIGTSMPFVAGNSRNFLLHRKRAPKNEAIEDMSSLLSDPFPLCIFNFPPAVPYKVRLLPECVIQKESRFFCVYSPLRTQSRNIFHILI